MKKTICFILGMAVIVLLLLLSSCAATQHRGNVRYRIAAVKDKNNGTSTVKIDGLKGWHLLPSDTLKVNDTILVTWIRKN